MPKPTKWLDSHPIVHEDHVPDLEIRAAHHEFKAGLKRDVAEKLAHHDYLREKATESAAHHYLGMKLAALTKDIATSKKHANAYESALKILGHNAVDTPPDEVLDLIKNGKVNPYKFTAHKNDVAIPQQDVIPQVDEGLQAKLERLTALKEQLKKG